MPDEEKNIMPDEEKNVIDKIKELLEDRISSGAASVHTGDKSISYMSVDDMIKLLNYLKGEQQISSGKKTPKNGLNIKLQWRNQ